MNLKTTRGIPESRFPQISMSVKYHTKPEKPVTCNVICKFLVTGILFILCNPVVLANPTAAEDIVRETTLLVLDKLATEREMIANDPYHLQKIVHEIITPHFDFETMTRLVLKDYWNKFSPPQRECLVKGFRNLLVNRYSHILLSYNNHEITYGPVINLGEQGYVTIRQTLSRDRDRPLPIDYPMHPDKNNLRVVDIVIDGVSLIWSYRGIFRYEIDRYGLVRFLAGFPECNAVK